MGGESKFGNSCSDSSKIGCWIFVFTFTKIFMVFFHHSFNNI